MRRMSSMVSPSHSSIWQMSCRMVRVNTLISWERMMFSMMVCRPKYLKVSLGSPHHWQRILDRDLLVAAHAGLYASPPPTFTTRSLVPFGSERTDVPLCAVVRSHVLRCSDDEHTTSSAGNFSFPFFATSTKMISRFFNSFSDMLRAFSVVPTSLR